MVATVVNPEVDDILIELKPNLVRLIANIPKIGVDDIPCTYHRNIVGVPRTLKHLLCQVAHAIVCYHEHHHA